MANETQVQASNTTNRVVVLFGAHTDTGGRPLNEDNVTAEMRLSADKPQLGNLFAVADGMGGGSAGGTASSIALGTLADQYFEVREASANPLENLQRAVAAASRAVFAFTQSSNYDRAVGTTIVAAAVTGSRVHIVNVGDSRAYLVRGGQIQALTRDHNWANQQIDQGMHPDQAHNHKNAPLLTHALGQSNSMPFTANGQPDNKFSFVYDLQPSDVLVLCSDGLAPVPERDIVHTVTSARAQTAAKRLTELAKQYGTTDNVSVAVYQYGAPLTAAAAPKRAAAARQKPAGGGFPLLPVLLGGAGIFVVLLIALVMLPGMISGGSGNTSGGRPTSQTSGGGGSNSNPLATPEATTAPGVATSTPIPRTATPAIGQGGADPTTPEPSGADTGDPADGSQPPPPTLIPTLPPAVANPALSQAQQQQTQQAINAANEAIQRQQQTANAQQPTPVPATSVPNTDPTEPPAATEQPTAEPTAEPPAPTEPPVPQPVSVPNVVGLLAGD
ncbi:SpoIIE family protein phosphatase, partial [bacterium]|nr:SpoIIE family protein phosphatase [bacterium]